VSDAKVSELARKWSHLQDAKDRLTALIYHLEGQGGIAYDLAPQRGVYIEKSPCPPEFLDYQQKTSADILEEYKISLRNTEKELEQVENQLNKLASQEDE
jgi:hypothetical protein